jgi:AbrB family looped-hinge helix DNA binding protein
MHLKGEGMLVRLSSRGQLVIPKAVRQALGLRAGTQFNVRLSEGIILLEPVTVSPITTLFGKYSDADFLTDMETEHRQELEDDKPIRA